KNTAIKRYTLHYLFALIGIYAVMMLATYLWLDGYGQTLIAFSVVADMLLYFHVLFIYTLRSSSPSVNWKLNATPVFGLLFGLFVSEFFMGGAFDIAYYGKVFATSIQLAPVAGGVLNIVGASLYDFVTYMAAITSSTWFLIMMGAEMGSLVIFRIKTVRELETKIRLGLIVCAYALYSILLPYFIIPPSRLPYTPFVGWSMGVGTGGAFAPAFLFAILLTYLISGVLSLLFGGRQVCSLFCTAALMYQGTFYDSLKTYNKKSTVARKLGRNKLSSLHYGVITAVWATIISTASISYLDSVHIIHLTVFGTDPVFFAYTFYFNVLWYVTFLTIPFVGTYACVSSGWCHWGTFNQFMGRLGFWKLKVRDPIACVNCKTKDCASACPVGLTSMPGAFISNGEFKNYRCIGVGDCVNACPVNNIQFYDVRHWLMERFAANRTKEEKHEVMLPK
ncbi:MAG: 4Fe-4S binding protein, partial [Methanomassiliicoccales archaeon]